MSNPNQPRYTNPDLRLLNPGQMSMEPLLPGRTLVRPGTVLAGSSGRIQEAKSWCYVDAAAPGSSFTNPSTMAAKSTVDGSYTDAASGQKAVINFERGISPGKLSPFENNLFVLGILSQGAEPKQANVQATWPASSGVKNASIKAYLRVTAIVAPFTTSGLTWNNLNASLTLGSVLYEDVVLKGTCQFNNFDTSAHAGQVTAFGGNDSIGALSDVLAVYDWTNPMPNNLYGLLVEMKPLATLDSGLTFIFDYAEVQFAIGGPSTAPLPAPYAVLKR